MSQSNDHQFPFASQIKHYKIDYPIGKGSFSDVYHARDLKNDRSVAIKIISRSIFKDEINLLNMEKELRIYERVDHPHIAKYYETIFTEEHIFIVMEYLSNGTLKDILYTSINHIPSQTVIIWYLLNTKEALPTEI